MTGNELLRVESLKVGYQSLNVIRDLSFTLAEGSALAVLGANGAGKSTLARALSGLVPIQAGRVSLAGTDLTRASAHEWRRAGVVHLPEGRGIFPGLSVRDNLVLGVRALKPKAARAAALDEVYEIFPVLRDRQRQIAGRLSGGEQQMLSLSRAFLVRPELIIADELSLGLAPRLVDEVFASLTRARAAGRSILLMEQFVHRAIEFADDCLILNHGESTWSGPTSQATGEVLERYLGVREQGSRTAPDQMT